MPLNDQILGLLLSTADARYPLLVDVASVPGVDKIPRSGSGGKLALGWIPQGVGSGLDADTLDGLESATFALDSDLVGLATTTYVDTGLATLAAVTQPLDVDLTALAQLVTLGFIKRTGAGAATAANLVIGDMPDLSGVYQPVNGTLTLLAGKGFTGTGNIVLDTGPTLVTPTIADLSNARHQHTSNATGGILVSYPILAPGGDGRNNISPTTDLIPLAIIGHNPQTFPLFNAQTSDGLGALQIDANGRLLLFSNGTAAVRGANLLTDGDFATDPSAIWTYAAPWTWTGSAMSYTGTTGPILAGGILLIDGGRGYTVGDVLTLTNGANDATVTVVSATNGRINAVTISNVGTACTVNAAVAVTGGTGAGAIFNIVFLALATALTYPAIPVTAGDYYVVTVTVSGFGAGFLVVGFGNDQSITLRANGARTIAFVSLLSPVASLTFTPSFDFIGIVDTISLQHFTPNPALITLFNKDLTVNTEIRGDNDQSNTSMGFYSGIVLETGLNNTLFGGGAGSRLNTGSNNVILGSQAGFYGPAVTSSVFVGYQAGLLSSSGPNTFVGFQAGKSNSTGSGNTYVGDSAGTSNVTGLNNVSIGHNAGAGSTTAASSIYIGANAAPIANAANNVVIGTGAASILTSGVGNIIIGTSAATNLRSGGSNTIIGNAAGLALQAGSSNVFIGVSAGSLETGNNFLYIANSNTATPPIWANLTSGAVAIQTRLGIGIQNGGGILDVVGGDQSVATTAIRVHSTSPELITATNDRTFAGAGNWTGANWTVDVAGNFLHTPGSTADAVLTAANMTVSQIVNQNTYRVAFSVTAATAGTITPKIGTNVGTTVTPPLAITASYVQWINASANDDSLIFTPSSDFNGRIDNISILRLPVIFSLNDAGNAVLTGSLTLSATGGANQFLKQTSAAGAVTVAGILSADLTTALTTPPAIGATTPSTIVGTTLGATFSDGGTATVVNPLIIDHESSGTPTASFGVGLLFRAKSATVANQSQGRIRTLWTTATDASRISNMILSVMNVAVEADVVTITPSGVSINGTLTLTDNSNNIAVGTSTGTKFGTATTQKMGWWNATPVVQQTDGAALTNSVTVGGTTNTIADFAASSYATDAGTIRNDIYQLARKLKIVDDALRLYGLLS